MNAKIRCQVSGIRYQVSGIRDQVSGIRRSYRRLRRREDVGGRMVLRPSPARSAHEFLIPDP
ncbi:MAG: hypothetical protein LBI62_06470 [Candidatus Accumulibacter sp.]|nr:hypothetical protein [Accumulibacter sp.]